MQTLDICGTPLAYRLTTCTNGARSAPTLLFCHALASNASIWNATVGAFAGKANTLVFDLPGHGQSGCAPEQSFAFGDLATLAHDLLDRLGIDRVHMIGVSVGGEVAQAFAAQYPERIDRMVLSSTACHTAEARAALWQQRIAEVEARGMAAIASATAQRWFSPHFAAENGAILGACADAIAATDLSAYMALARVIARMDLRDTNRAIAAPTLITFGSEDHNTGAAAAALIASTIPGSRKAEFAGAGHFPHLEDPARWNETIDAFLFPPTAQP